MLLALPLRPVPLPIPLAPLRPPERPALPLLALLRWQLSLLPGLAPRQQLVRPERRPLPAWLLPRQARRQEQRQLRRLRPRLLPVLQRLRSAHHRARRSLARHRRLHCLRLPRCPGLRHHDHDGYGCDRHDDGDDAAHRLRLPGLALRLPDRRSVRFSGCWWLRLQDRWQEPTRSLQRCRRLRQPTLRQPVLLRPVPAHQPWLLPAPCRHAAHVVDAVRVEDARHVPDARRARDVPRAQGARRVQCVRVAAGHRLARRRGLRVVHGLHAVRVVDAVDGPGGRRRLPWSRPGQDGRRLVRALRVPDGHFCRCGYGRAGHGWRCGRHYGPATAP